MDRVVTASAANGTVSFVAGTTTELVREAQIRHDLAPTAAAAVGRLITAAALLGASLEKRERVTLQIVGDGPLGAITADSWRTPHGQIAVRGYARNPRAERPLNALGKFDVGGAIGRGHLQLTRSYEIGQPYVGVVPLVSGEIGDDLAGYFANSQQIPSVVALGVLAGPEGIKAAGGVIAQLLPGSDDALIARLEANAAAMAPVTTQIAGGATEADFIAGLAAGLDLRMHDAGYHAAFDCMCTREKVETALMGLGRDELLKLAREREETEATCDFCRRRYVLSAGDVQELAARFDA
jgi:molecular chaperone Hsp33